MTWAVAAPAIIITGALAIIGLERLRPYDRQRFWRRGFAVVIHLRLRRDEFVVRIGRRRREQEEADDALRIDVEPAEAARDVQQG